MRRGARGFTLVELGIVIAVIAVLATIVLWGRGVVRGSQTGAAIQLVDSVRRAARIWAERNNMGRDFAGITLNALTAPPAPQAPLLRNVDTPWRDGSLAVSIGGNP